MGIEAATFRRVVQYLNELRYRVRPSDALFYAVMCKQCATEREHLP